jgi:hypothetical protein
MGTISSGDIAGAIKGVTGDPVSGVVHDITPALIAAIDQLINGPKVAPQPESRVIKASETRKESDKE